jgi:hypothetical protein
MTLCCYDLRYECTSECAAACLLPSAEEEGATKIVCIRLVRESQSFSSAKSETTVDGTLAAKPTIPPTQDVMLMLYR